MIASPTIADRVRQAFTPTPLGVNGLVDQLLRASVGSEVVFERVGNCCVYRWTMAGETQEGTVPFQAAAFRTILARIAALCDESQPDSVSPYGGDTVLQIPGHPTEPLRVQFSNTIERHQLMLSGAAVTEIVEEKPPVEQSGMPDVRV